MGAQWKSARLMTHIVQQYIHQPRLKFPATTLGWLFDCPPQFLLVHYANVFLLLGQGLAQLWIICTVGIKVGAQGNDKYDWPIDLRCGCEQVVNKVSPFFFRMA